MLRRQSNRSSTCILSQRLDSSVSLPDRIVAALWQHGVAKND
jgi:hypothetical protein